MSKKGYKISKEIKDEIINKIKHDGLAVAETATQYGISSRTIYAWLGTKATGTVSLLEYNKLKKENEREKTDRTSILNNQQSEYTRVCQRLDSLFQMRLNLEIEPDLYIAKKQELELEQRRLKFSLDSIDQRIANWFQNADRLMTFAERAVEEFRNGDMKKQRTILSTLGHTHIMKDGVLRLKTEKPLHVWQEVVLQIDDEDKLLEPINDIAIKGYSKKIWVLDTKLWRWGELNSRPN